MTALVTPLPAASPRRSAAGGTPTSGHLRQVDVVRVITFACVIGVHAISHTNGASRNAAVAGMLLHFTREVFFVLTGFVLFHAYARKPLRASTFWRRRSSLVLLPYLTWTLIYLEYSRAEWPTSVGWWHRFGYDLLTGNAEYHLYFLLVTLQIYLLFPLLLRVVRATRGHHGVLFAGALAVELAETWALHGPGRGATGFAGAVVRQSGTLLPSYLFYVVVGALAAVHLARWQQFVDRHRAAIFWFLTAAGVVTVWVHEAQIHSVADIGPATDVLQPVMVLWSSAVAVALYALGSRWVGRAPGARAIRILDEASLISFGVYLAHPLLLQIFSDHWLGLGNGWITAPASTILLVAVTVVSTTLVVETARRTTLSLALTGRPAAKKGATPAPEASEEPGQKQVHRNPAPA